MIKLQKGPEPNVLQADAERWTAELLAAGDKAKAKNSRYGHPDVKAALIAETNGKCAYCESKLLHIAYGDVEHIVASRYPGATGASPMAQSCASFQTADAVGDEKARTVSSRSAWRTA